MCMVLVGSFPGLRMSFSVSVYAGEGVGVYAYLLASS